MVLEHCGLPVTSFCGIGIGVPGHVTEKGSFVINSSNIWQTFDANKIRNAFSLPIVFENNVRCMALGQYLFHPEYTPENFAFFHVGTGMFCANIVDGSLFTGHTFISGEIGHIIANPTGLRCECGKQGCLQTVASEASLIKNARQLYQLDAFGILHRLVSSPEEISIETIAAAYALGDEAICTIVSNALKYLGIAISNIAILNNPEKIYLHGQLFSHPLIHSELSSILTSQLTFVENDYVKNFEICPFDNLDGATGACALAIQKLFLKKGLTE